MRIYTFHGRESFEWASLRYDLPYGFTNGTASLSQEYSDSLTNSSNEQRVNATVTILTNNEGYLTKVYKKDVDGSIRKTAAAQLVRGTYQVKEVFSLAELDKVFDDLTPHQAVTYGRPETDSGQLVAKSIESVPGAITRTREHFSFASGQGVLMIDHDPPKNGMALSADDLVAAIKTACTALVDVQMLWRPSSSSGIDSGGIKGQRLYVFVDDATQIPRIGKIIFDRLWLAGYGYYVISKSGQFLERSPIDAAVFQAERMDFAAQPVLKDGIQKIPYLSKVYPGTNSLLQVSTVQEFTEQERKQLESIKRNARGELEPEAARIREEYCYDLEAQLTLRLQKTAPDDNVRLHVRRAVYDRLLMGEWELLTSSGVRVTVGEILDNPAKWHNTRFADPLEPDNDRRVAWANLRSGGRPYLYSHRHGGVRYILERAPALIQLQSGQLPQQVDAVVEILAKGGDLFTHAEGVVYVNEERRIIPVKSPWFAVHAQRHVRFERFNQKENKWLPAGCPAEVTSGVLALASTHQFPKLTAVRTAPTMDTTGRVISAMGYDEKTGLLLIAETGETWPTIPQKPTHKQLEQAFTLLWKAFAQFPYASKEDASVALAAVMTTAIRVCVRTSPGFGFSATAPGTGKTLLAQCIGLLYDGTVPGVSSPITQEEEWAKALFAAVIGGETTLLFDNAEQGIESASVCAAITSPSIKGRVLGESRTAMAEHRLLIMATGNGLRLIGDLNRRFLTCRLDARMEATAIVGRHFEFNPLAYCAEHRDEIQAAALTLIRGYAAAGFPRVCDAMASFDDWNKLVRSAIVWLIEQGIAIDFVDPILALKRDSATDPDAAQLEALVENVATVFGVGKRFSIAELIDKRLAYGNELSSILDDIAGDTPGQINRKRLGRWVETREGRVVNGMALVRDGKNRAGSVMWKLKKQA